MLALIQAGLCGGMKSVGQVPQKLVIFKKIRLQCCHLEESKTVSVNLALYFAVFYSAGMREGGSSQRNEPLDPPLRTVLSKIRLVKTSPTLSAVLLKPRLHDTTGCQTGCTIRFDNRFDNRVERTATVRSTGCQTGLTTGLTTGCIV